MLKAKGSHRLIEVAFGLIVAISVGVAAAGKGPFAHETANANVQQTATTNGPVETNARHFKRIPGAAPTESSTPDGQPWIGSVTVTVMVVVKSGKGALRVIDGENNDPADGSRMYPASVNIAGKGPHTVTFILGAGQDYVFPPEPQWKRTGDGPLKAKTVVTSIQGSVV
jgi:hypothetical protein